jgi:hypothetical protein
MKKITVTKKDGTLAALFQADSISEQEALNSIHHFWGKPERWVLHKDELMAEAYDDADVLEEEMRDTLDGVAQKWVKLKSEYTVEIEDITAQHALAEVIAKRVAEYPSAEEFLNAFFDGGQAALDALQAARLAVKAKYPKP